MEGPNWVTATIAFFVVGVFIYAVVTGIKSAIDLGKEPNSGKFMHGLYNLREKAWFKAWIITFMPLVLGGVIGVLMDARVWGDLPGIRILIGAGAGTFSNTIYSAIKKRIPVVIAQAKIPGQGDSEEPTPTPPPQTPTFKEEKS